MVELGGFPELDNEIKCNWAPITIEPIPGSGECLTIGVAVVSNDQFFLARANSWKRLECLYDDRAGTVIFAAQASLDAIEEDLSIRALAALTEPTPAFSSVNVGSIRDGSGNSIEEIALYWMGATSSLYSPLHDKENILADLVAMSEIREQDNRLSGTVFREVSKTRSELSLNFGKHVSTGSRRTNSPSRVVIDYRSSRLVANFGTLIAGNIQPSQRKIKSALWDLKIDRDEASTLNLTERYELLVQRPAEDDPQFSEMQIERMMNALSELERQAEIEEIRLCAKVTPSEIANHIVELEAA